MRHLILIKHSQPVVELNVPAKQWRLSGEGRRRCSALAQRLSHYDLGHVVASTEGKASGTAQLVAAKLNLPWHTADGLHEYDRSDEPFGTPERFQELVANFFTRPDRLVFGKETAHEALTRFAIGVEHVLAKYAAGNIAVVAHGTVISLFVAAYNQIDPFALWRQLALPSFVVLALPSFALVEQCF